jgi:hypothetical protein
MVAHTWYSNRSRSCAEENSDHERGWLGLAQPRDSGPASAPIPVDGTAETMIETNGARVVRIQN